LTGESLVIPLESLAGVEAERPLVGGKALGLALARRAGLAVPRGFCVTTVAYRAHAALAGGLREAVAAGAAPEDIARAAGAAITAAPVEPRLEAAVRAALAELTAPGGDGERLAVRSSAPWEDARDASYGGMLESFVGVAGAAAVIDAIKRCWASGFSARAIHYRRRRGEAVDYAGGPAVIVHEAVAGELGGVAFSIDPVSGADRVAIEYAAAGPAAVVDGRGAVGRLAVAAAGDGGLRVLDRVAAGEAALDDASALAIARACHRLAALAGGPVDVEWVMRGGEVVVLQVRPVTAGGSGPPPLPADCECVLVDRFADPVSPCYASFLQRFAGRVRLSMLQPRPGRCAERPYVVYACRVYWNVRYEKRYFDVAAAVPLGAPGHCRAKARFLYYAATCWWRWYRCLPRYLYRARRLGRRDLRRLDLGGLLGHVRAVERNFYRGIGMEHFIALSLARATYDALRGALRGVPDGARRAAALASSSGRNMTVRVNAELRALAGLAAADPWTRALFAATPPGGIPAALAGDDRGRPLRLALAAFLARHGHRATGCDDLASPRWREDPAHVIGLVQALAARVAAPTPDPAPAPAAPASSRRAPLWPLRLALVAHLAREYMALRENQRYYFDHSWVLLRAALLEIGRRLAAAGALGRAEDVFLLRVDELLDLDRAPASDQAPALDQAPAADPGRLGDVAAQRRRELLAATCLAPPYYIKGGQAYSVHAGESRPSMKCLGVSPGLARGPARIVRRAEDIGRLRAGDIAVVPMLHPSWTPALLVASGVVMNYGNALSHGAVVAREYGVPAVALNGPATDIVRDGQPLTLDGTRGRLYVGAAVETAAHETGHKTGQETGGEG
jgi:pyruvate,water dikinase